MGSYGIGISRIPAAIIEYQSEDNTGIVWPKNIAPFSLLIINLKVDDENISKFCKLIYDSLKKIGVSILYDDRNERPGIKFSDAELIGIPYNLIVGKNFIDKDTVTLKDKYSDKEFDLKVKEAEKKILEHMKH
jgi:prolyl-tRNA synthetase